MIVSAGLSPAWQQLLRFDALQIGEVNRAQSAAWCASGKVINVAVAVAKLGEPVSMISAIGGLTGDAIQKELQLLNVEAEWIQTADATRVCTSVLEADGRTTELVENTAKVAQEVIEDFVDRAHVYANIADVTVLTGSLPAGAPVETFARVMRAVPRRFLLDIRGPALECCLPLSPFLVKPNREELQITLQRELTSDRALIEGMRELNQRGAEWVLVSDGAQAVWLSSGERVVKLVPPKVTVINPIGCGDCLAAGIAVRLRQNADMIEAVRFGIGAASQNAEQLLPARLNLTRCEELAEQVSIDDIT